MFMNSKSFKCGLFLACLLGTAVSASAIPFTVDALANSSSGGSAANTVTLNAGDVFSISVAPTDLWSAGGLPRWSNANGLTGNLFATGSDESGQPAGTLIGQNFGTHTQGNLTAPFGALVGQIGSGDFFLVGTSFTGSATSSGVLRLYYWDANNFDNSEHVTIEATVRSAQVPDSGLTIALLGSALVGLAALKRRLK
jgi:hypothetical protein